jgi:hypothetical protein
LAEFAECVWAVFSVSSLFDSVAGLAGFEPATAGTPGLYTGTLSFLKNVPKVIRALLTLRRLSEFWRDLLTIGAFQLTNHPLSIGQVFLKAQRKRRVINMLQPGTGADSFEREVFGLFKEFAKKGLIDELAGGPKNKLEIDQQVDMSFRFSKGSHDYFFIWECKNPEDPDNFSLKPAVEQLKIRYGLIEEKYKPKYCPSAVIKPVLAVNITLDQFKNTPDSVLQLMNPQPPYFTKDHVDYYSQLLTAYGVEYTFPTLMLEVFNIRIEYDGPFHFRL